MKSLGHLRSLSFLSRSFFFFSLFLNPPSHPSRRFFYAREEERAGPRPRSVPPHSWRNDGEEGLATMHRFKLERGVATSRRRGPRPSKHAPSFSLPYFPETENKRVERCKRDAGNYLLRWNDDGRVSPIRSHGARFKLEEGGRGLKTPKRIVLAVCWNVVVVRRYTTQYERNVLIAKFAAPIVEKLRQCGRREGIVLSYGRQMVEFRREPFSNENILDIRIRA